jgi:hypothetical protein
VGELGGYRSPWIDNGDLIGDQLKVASANVENEQLTNWPEVEGSRGDP